MGSSQLMDVTIRVPEVREFSVQQMEKIIIENGLISDAHNMQSNAICRILEASAYIVGEYSGFVNEHITLVSAMLQSRIASLPQEIQCIFIHNALKVVCAGLPDNDLIEATVKLLEPLTTSSFIEVQERSNAYLFFLKWYAEQSEEGTAAIIVSFRQLFSSELMPLHPNSQQVIADKVPTGLSLDDWIGEPFPDDSSDDDSILSDIEHQNIEDWYSDGHGASNNKPDDIWKSDSSPKNKKKLTKKQRAAVERQSNARKARQTGPWYIAGDDDEDAMQTVLSSDDESGSGDDDDKRRKRKKRDKKKNHKLSKKDIQNADIVEIDLGEEIKVGPKAKRNNMLKVDKSQLPKKSKKYTVIKKNKKERKKMQALKITANTVNTDDYVSPLSFDMDLEGPIDLDNEMPTIKPYNQDG